jgi:hypothetical protein
MCVAWLALIAVAITLVFAYPRGTHIDFVAFYCAGEAVAGHADPYLQLPLYDCEYRVTAEGGYPYSVTIPAPLPPYGLLPFAILSRLPFVSAYVVFTSLAIIALLAGGALLRRITGGSAALVAAAIAPSAWDNVVKGQPVPFVFLAILVAGLGVQHGRSVLAAIAAAASMIEPHVGLPVCLALFIGAPRTRCSLVTMAVAFGITSLALLPAVTTWEYISRVLPLHAASEAIWVTQLSLVNPLVLLGVKEKTAIALAVTQYVLTSSLGVATAVAMSKRFAVPEYLALIPPIFALLGGPYVHYNLLLLAVPAAIVAVSRAKKKIYYAALASVSLPWLALGIVAPTLIAIASVFTIGYMWRSRFVTATRCAAAIAFVAFARENAYLPSTPHPLASKISQTSLAETSWATYVRSANPVSEGQWTALTMKVPTWGGLVCLSMFFITSGLRGVSRQYGASHGKR